MLGLLAAGGCSKEGETQAESPPQPAPSQSATSAPSMTAPAPSTTLSANVPQNVVGGVLAAGAAALSGLTGGALGPIQQGIGMKAQTDAKGMTPDGQLMSASLVPNGRAEAMLTLQPGACYTIVGFGGLGVFDFQIRLSSAPPLPAQEIAVSAPGRPDPTVGPGDQCLRSPFPVPTPVKVELIMLRGQGMVGAQVYKK